MSQPLEESQPDVVQICPLCQGANQCAVSLGKGIEDCWCSQQVFPPLAALQAKVSGLQSTAISNILPSADACICLACLSQLKQGLTQGHFAAQDEKAHRD